MMPNRDPDASLIRKLLHLGRHLWAWYPARFRWPRGVPPATDRDLLDEDEPTRSAGIPEADLSEEERLRAVDDMKRRLGA